MEPQKSVTYHSTSRKNKGSNSVISEIRLYQISTEHAVVLGRNEFALVYLEHLQNLRKKTGHENILCSSVTLL